MEFLSSRHIPYESAILLHRNISRRVSQKWRASKCAPILGISEQQRTAATRDRVVVDGKPKIQQERCGARTGRGYLHFMHHITNRQHPYENWRLLGFPPIFLAFQGQPVNQMNQNTYTKCS